MRQPKSPTQERAHLAHLQGRRAEQAACDYLEAEGFEILGRNLRIRRLEVDILCRRQELIVVVEVRHRGPAAWVRALNSLDHRKRRRLRSAGEALWRARFAKDASASRMRFDLVSVSFAGTEPRIEHVSAAF